MARTWGGKVPLANASGFHQHLLATGVADYRRHPECVEVTVLRRDSDDWAHFLLLSTWSTTDAIHEYAGGSSNKAVHYPGDEAFGLVPDDTVTHYDVLPATQEPRCTDGARAPDAIRIVNADELRAHVRFEDLIEPMSTAVQQSSAGFAENGLVVMYPLESRDRGDVYVKTGTLQGHPVFIVKVSPWFAVNVERGRAQGGFVGVFDSATGHTIALLNEEHYLSDIRTAAAGALAARALAPRDVRTASVLGAGVQAYWQTLALYHERPFATLLIWARNSDKAMALRSRLAEALPGVDIRVEADLEGVVRSADVLICATQSREPLVNGAWLHEGQHITAVGADDPSKCEVDARVLARARVIVDSLAASIANGDVHRAIAAGKYSRDDVAGELGDVLAGRAIGRRSDLDITVAKFVGIGAQDLVAAEVALERLGILHSSNT